MEEELFENKSVPIQLLLKPELNKGLERIKEDLPVKIPKSILIEVAIYNFIENYDTIKGLIAYSNEFKSEIESK